MIYQHKSTNADTRGASYSVLFKLFTIFHSTFRKPVVNVGDEVEQKRYPILRARHFEQSLRVALQTLAYVSICQHTSSYLACAALRAELARRSSSTVCTSKTSKMRMRVALHLLLFFFKFCTSKASKLDTVKGRDSSAPVNSSKPNRHHAAYDSFCARRSAS